MGHLFRLIVLAPILLVQALYVRKVTPRLPEAKGERRGSLKANDNHTNMSVLIIGDSSAAGVGVEQQVEALAGQLADSLTPHFNIDWQLLAQTGATSTDGLQWIQQQSRQKIQFVITVFGVNDVTHMHSTDRWKQEQQALFESLQLRYARPHVIACGLPPVSRFPALPQPLRWHLGKRAEQFDAQLQALTVRQDKHHYCALDFSLDERLIASDGFHPGAGIYKPWAEKLAGIIRALAEK